MRLTIIISGLLFLILLSSCATKKYKNVPYLSSEITKENQPTLNIFTPRNSSNNRVLIFVHGGNWNSGNKKLYSFFGRNFAKKGITTVIVGYSLSPNADYNDMANEVAKAIDWTKLNIQNYKGNPNSIFLTGHSAGGHLIALAANHPKYLADKSIVKGIILNDAAGLDMKHYLEEFPPTEEDNYLKTWSNNPVIWKQASPIYFLDKNSPPFLIYIGSKTYKSIKVSNERFLEKLHTFQPDVKPIILNKKHVPMMLQYIFPWSKRYNEILDFMKKNDN